MKVFGNWLLGVCLFLLSLAFFYYMNVDTYIKCGDAGFNSLLTELLVLGFGIPIWIFGFVFASFARTLFRKNRLITIFIIVVLTGSTTFFVTVDHVLFRSSPSPGKCFDS